ncbi:hypothetical protein Tco_0483843 [Tanacetum coccineum]
MVHRLLLCPTKIRSLRLIFGKDYRKLGELVLSSVHHFILKPLVKSERGPVRLLEDMLRGLCFGIGRAFEHFVSGSRKCRAPICWDKVEELTFWDQGPAQSIEFASVPLRFRERIGEVFVSSGASSAVSIDVHDLSFIVSSFDGDTIIHPLHVAISYPFDLIKRDMSLSKN